MTRQEGITPPTGGYNKEDEDALSFLAKVYQDNASLLEIIEWYENIFILFLFMKSFD